MRVLIVFWLSFVTLPCLGDPEPPAQKTDAPPPVAADAAPKTGAREVQVVTIDPNARPPVCRRVVPTGSRIAERRCESPKERTTAADEANRDILRRDIQALRDQQMARDQARQAAMAEALRRRAQGL
jgi:hypothetical protein